MAKVDPLEPLRCPRGCDTRFINYLIYEESELRVAESRREVKGLRSVTVWDLGLRCGDCGTQYGLVKDVNETTKLCLDAMLEKVASSLEDLLGAEDDRLLREAIESLPLMIEDNGS